MPRDARQRFLTELCVYLTASIAQRHPLVLNSSHSFLELNLSLAALFQQAEKQPCARGLLQGPVPWPSLSKTLQAQAPKQSTTFQLFMHFFCPEPAREKEHGCEAAGRLGKPALQSHLEAIWNSTKPKSNSSTDSPAYFCFNSEKTGWIISELPPTQVHWSLVVQTYILSQYPCLLFILRYWPRNMFSNKISVSSHWHTS